MLVIGLTGGIGCGKSIVSSLFSQKYNIPVLDADIIARDISNKPHVKRIIRDTFGNKYFDQNNTLLRDKIRLAIFEEPELRKELEDILHPLVYDEIQSKLELINNNYCLVVIPLLLEKNRKSFLNRVLVIDCSEKTQIKRVMMRDQCSEDNVKNIIATQISRDDRLKLADDIIVNDSDIFLVEQQIEKLHKKYLDLSK